MINAMERKKVDLTKRYRDDQGIKCPDCGCRHFWKTYESRPEGGTVFRIKECRHCGKRIKTRERIEEE